MAFSYGSSIDSSARRLKTGRVRPRRASNVDILPPAERLIDIPWQHVDHTENHGSAALLAKDEESNVTKPDLLVAHVGVDQFHASTQIRDDQENRLRRNLT
jgi:hypothetical protein